MLLRQTFFAWLPTAILVTVLAGLVYVTAQQSLRQTANDRPQQLAEDVTAQLMNGNSLPAAATVNVGTSLAPFFVVYDANGQAIGGTGILNGSLATPPAGVFVAAKTNSIDRVTWQPQPGVRIASVTIYHDGATPGYVLAGQSLRLTEQHEDQALNLSMLGWFVALIGSFFAEGLHQGMLASVKQRQ